MVRVEVQTRKGKSLGFYDVSTVDELGEQFEAAKNISRHRARFTVPVDGKNVVVTSMDGFKANDMIQFKDLGPQVSWKGVFLFEYGGPFLIHPLMYFFSPLYYALWGFDAAAVPAEKHWVQTLAMWMCVAHYGKRLLETLFVHRFSNATMPIMNIFKNSSHYWGLGGVFVGHFLYHPLYQAPTNETLIYAMVGVWAVAELGNLRVHYYFRTLRPAGSKERKIPMGGLFSLISCPNYFYEVVGWVAFSVLCSVLSSWIFAVVGGLQMLVWAGDKHRRYKKEFGDKYPRGRKAMIPFLM